MYAPPHLPTSVPETFPGAPTTAPLTATTLAPSPKTFGDNSSDGATPGPRVADQTGLAPAVPGTYRYDTTGVSTFGLTTLPYPAVTTLTVGAPGGTRQRWTRDLRDEGGSGPVSQFALDFRPDGVYLDELVLTNSFGGMVNVQNLRPSAPQLLVPTGAAPGAHSAFDLNDGAGGVAHVTVAVTGQEPVIVAGQSFDAIVVRTAIALPPGQVSGHVELTGWLAPVVRVWAKEHFVADASAAGGLFTFHSQYDAVAQSLSPS